VAFAASAVVTREGRIATYGLLQADHASAHPRSTRDEADVTAVLDGVRRSRFAPAEAAGGTKVAVNMVWLLVRTTARGTARADTRVDARPAAEPAPDVVKPEEPEDAPVSVPSTELSAPASTTA
jgi:hypothetical protein